MISFLLKRRDLQQSLYSTTLLRRQPECPLANSSQVLESSRGQQEPEQARGQQGPEQARGQQEPEQAQQF